MANKKIRSKEGKNTGRKLNSGSGAANLKESYQSAVLFCQHGLFWQARSELAEILRRSPGHGPSLVLMSDILAGQKEHDLAAEYLERSLSGSHIDLKRAARNFVAWGFPQKAVKIYRQLLLDRKGDQLSRAVILNDLGDVLYEAKEVDLAMGAFREALVADPYLANAHNGLGVCLADKGELDEAICCFYKIVSSPLNNGNFSYNLASLLRAKGAREEAVAWFERIVISMPKHPEARIQLAIHAWINGNWAGCAEHLGVMSYSRDRFMAPYGVYLKDLLRFRVEGPDKFLPGADLPPLFVIGDSNCLSPANTVVELFGSKHLVKPCLVIGCLAWHLGNSLPNKHSTEFESMVSALPHGARVIAMFGELDCRIGEGIMRHYKKSCGDLESEIVALLDGYLAYIIGVFRARGIVPVIYGVPAALVNEKEMSATDIDLVNKIISVFNRGLMTRAAESGVSFIDIYGLTIRENGYQDGKIHLDRHHLKPAVFGLAIKEAWVGTT